MVPSISSLPRFPLSIILSYLQQPSSQNNTNLSSNGRITYNTPTLPHNRDALSLLLTSKRLAYAILPLFRVPKQACREYQYRTKGGKLVAVVEKYRFAVLPVKDPRTLLDRLNTRRLRGRILWMKMSNDGPHLKTCQEEGEGVEVERGTESPYYQHGRTIEELAFEEWTMMEIDYSDDGMVDDNESGRKNNHWRIWPAHLELLRFLESDSSRELQEQSEVCKREDDIESATANISLLGGQLFGNDISLLSSYPRSGNTLLRTLLERITSYPTGSDTRPDRTLSRSLALEHDLVGEGLVGPNKPNANQTKSESSVYLQNLYQSAYDPLVHIVKTHFPERKGWKPVNGNRVLLLVRNPYDAIDSYWNLCCTNTHTRTLDESVYTKYAQKFEGLARHEIQVWCDFHYYWIDICEKEGVPLLVVRYEDLVLDTEAEMLRVMTFLIGQRGGGGEDSKLTSFWEWRIRHAIGKSTAKSSAEKTKTGSKPATQNNQTNSTNTSNLGSYQPRSSNGGLLSIGKSIRKKRYSESVLCHMHDVAASLELTRKQNSNQFYPATTSERNQTNHMTLLQQFGYDIYTQQFPENFTQPPAIASRGSGERKGTVVINKTLEIRNKDDPFGRAMTNWRRGETYRDTKPFPTIPR